MKNSLFPPDIHKINSGLQSVKVVFAALFYFENYKTEEKRKSIQSFLDEFIDNFGDDFNSFRIDGTAHEWTGKNLKRQLLTIRKKLAKTGLYSEYTFHFAHEDAYKAATTLGIFAHAFMNTEKAVCGFILPFDLALEKKDFIKKFFLKTCDALSVDQAYGGLTLGDRANYYFDGRAHDDRKRINEIQNLLLQNSFFDFLHTDMMDLPNLSNSDEFRKWAVAASYGYVQKPGKKSLELKVDPNTVEFKPMNKVWGLRWPSAMNFLGENWVAKIGGFNFIKKQLNNFEVEKLEKGIYMGASKLPYISPQELKEIAQISSKYRLSPDLKSSHDLIMRPILNPKKTLEWIRRFD